MLQITDNAHRYQDRRQPATSPSPPLGQLPFRIEQRAAVAAIMVNHRGWRPKAGGRCCSASVRPISPLPGSSTPTIGSGSSLGELKLAALRKDHLRHLAERRAQRLAAEREAKVQAERAAQARAVDDVLETAGNRPCDRRRSYSPTRSQRTCSWSSVAERTTRGVGQDLAGAGR